MDDKASPGRPELLYASAAASVNFALHCLEPVGDGQRLRARSTFLDPMGRAMHWHDFGDLEGPGWAANAVGGAHLLYRWGSYTGDNSLRRRALQLIDHVLYDGFCEDGFVWPYWDLARRRFCLNYAHGDDWLCPGSLALVGVQMLDLAADLDAGPRPAFLRDAARALSKWLCKKVVPLENGWLPRRITPDGHPYPLTPEGRPDPIYDHSADGLYLLLLWAMTGEEERALSLGDVFVTSGGFWGSLNHDTCDDHENVAYAVAFRVLRRAGDRLDRPAWREFAWQVALPALERFRMPDDRHGVVTKGLYWMEESWDTAYLWENAEIAQSHLEAWLESGQEQWQKLAIETLTAIAHHHYGPLGFLAEGVDWNDHVGRRHHVYHAPYGAIRYTEPLLNNLHLLWPTLTYLQAIGFSPPASIGADEAVRIVRALSIADRRRLSSAHLDPDFTLHVKRTFPDVPDAIRQTLLTLGGGEVQDGGSEVTPFFLDAPVALRCGIGVEPGEEDEVTAWETALIRMGLPLGRPFDAPHLITATAARAMDRYAWGSALQEGALLTAGAVLIGAGRWLDVKVNVLPSGVHEVCTDDPLNGAHAGELLHAVEPLGPEGDTPPSCHSFTLGADVNARVLSRWVGADGEDHGAGVVALERTDGGRVVLIPHQLPAPACASVGRVCRDLWWAVLSWVWKFSLPYRILSGVPYLYLLADPDDGEVLLIAVNLADEAAQIAINAGDAPVLRLDDDGRWREAGDPRCVQVPARSLVVHRFRCNAPYP